MGGNVKDAFTSEPKVTRTCNVCETDFKDTVKYGPKQVCKSCKSRLNDVENLEPGIEINIDSDTRTLEIIVTLKSTVDDNIDITVPADEDGREKILGMLRVEADNGDWYEDAWVVEDTYDFSVRRGATAAGFKWTNDFDETESVRDEYRNVVGDPFDADSVTAEFTFIADIDSVSTTADLPTFLVDL